MLRIMQAEAYKTTRRKYTYVLIGLCLLAMVLLALLVGMNDHLDYTDYIELLPHMLPFVGVLTYFVAQIVFSDEYRNGTIKNVAAMGTSRVSFYFGKLAVQIVLGIAMYIGIFLAGMLMGRIFFSMKGQAEAIALFFDRLLAALPLLIGLISMANLLCFTLKSSVMGASIFFLAMLLLPNILVGIGQLISIEAREFMVKVAQFLASSQLAEIGMCASITSTMVTNSLILGGAYLVGGTAIGLAGFMKRELQ